MKHYTCTLPTGTRRWSILMTLFGWAFTSDWLMNQKEDKLVYFQFQIPVLCPRVRRRYKRYNPLRNTSRRCVSVAHTGRMDSIVWKYTSGPWFLPNLYHACVRLPIPDWCLCIEVQWMDIRSTFGSSSGNTTFSERSLVIVRVRVAPIHLHPIHILHNTQTSFTTRTGSKYKYFNSIMSTSKQTFSISMI